MSADLYECAYTYAHTHKQTGLLLFLLLLWRAGPYKGINAIRVGAETTGHDMDFIKRTKSRMTRTCGRHVLEQKIVYSCLYSLLFLLKKKSHKLLYEYILYFYFTEDLNSWPLSID